MNLLGTLEPCNDVGPGRDEWIRVNRRTPRKARRPFERSGPRLWMPTFTRSAIRSPARRAHRRFPIPRPARVIAKPLGSPDPRSGGRQLAVKNGESSHPLEGAAYPHVVGWARPNTVPKIHTRLRSSRANRTKILARFFVLFLYGAARDPATH